MSSAYIVLNLFSVMLVAASRPPPPTKCEPELCTLTKDGELATCKKQVSISLRKAIH